MLNMRYAHYVVFFSGNVPQFGLCVNRQTVQIVWKQYQQIGYVLPHGVKDKL